MLPLAFSILLVAAALGTVLTALHLRPGGVPPRPAYGALHGAAGVVGLAGLLLALGGPPRGVAMGVGSFGRIAAVLLVIALLVGVLVLVMRLRARRITGLVIGIHATLAISGVVILAAYVLLG